MCLDVIFGTHRDMYRSMLCLKVDGLLKKWDKLKFKSIFQQKVGILMIFVEL